MTKAFTLDLYQLYLARVAAALAVTCAVSVFLYATFLLMAVSHAAAHASLQKSISMTTEHLGELEQQYLAATKSITPQKAAELGFAAPIIVATVYTNTPTHTLSYAGR